VAADNVQALIAYGEPERTGMTGFAPDAYFSNDRPGATPSSPLNKSPPGPHHRSGGGHAPTGRAAPLRHRRCPLSGRSGTSPD